MADTWYGTPELLGREVASAETYRDRFTQQLEDIRSVYTSPRYDSSAGRRGDHATYPVNHPLEWLGLKLPQMSYANPRWRVGSRRRTPFHRTMAEAIRSALNRWSKDVEMGRTLERLVCDVGMAFGIGLVTRERARDVVLPEKERGRLRQVWGLSPQEPVTPRRPGFQRVSPGLFFIDPAAPSWEQARFMGHAEVWIRKTLEEVAESDPDGGWHLSAIRGLTTTTSPKELGRDWTVVPDRGEVKVYYVLVFEENLEEVADDDLYNGTIHTLALTGEEGERSAIELREPKPFFGPPWGPYVLFGALPVPDRIFPLGPLTAVSEQVDSINEVRRAIERSARSWKRFSVADSTVAKKVKQAPHDWVVAIEGFDRSKLMEITQGGLDPQQITLLEMLSDQLDRTSGMSEVSRGAITGRGTATEVAEAASKDDARSAFLVESFRGAVSRAGRAASWYMYHDNRVVFSVGGEGPQGQDYWFFGGPSEESEKAPWSDLELESQPESTAFIGSGVRRRDLLDLISAAGAIAQLELQAPQVDTQPLWAQLGDAFNLPFAEELSDPKIRQQVLGTMAQAQAPRAGLSQGGRAGTGYTFGNTRMPRLSGGSGAQQGTGGLLGRSAGALAASAGGAR